MTPPLTPAESRDATRTAARTAAWGLAIYLLTRIIGVVFASASMATAVGQAIAAEWGAGRVGVAWSDPHERLPTAGQMARRAVIGAAIGAAAAGVVALFAWATRAVLVEKVDGPVAGSLVAVGLVTAALTAMRDELILHGITLRAISSVGSPVARALACGVTSAAAALGDVGPTPRTVVSHFLLGTVFGALWVRDRGAWMPWGAHAAWLFVSGTLLGGGVAEMRVATSSWGGNDAGILGGTAAILALAPVAMAALAFARRRAAP